MQFFTPFGLWSYIGVLISGFILGFIGRQVAKIGTAFSATNHESTLQYILAKNLVKFSITFLSFSYLNCRNNDCRFRFNV